MALFKRILLLVALLLAHVSAFAGSISGNLTIPVPITTLTSDMQIRIRADSPGHVGTRLVVQLTITAAEASSGTPKPFALNNLQSGANYTLSYECTGSSFPEPCKEVVARAYYHASGTPVIRGGDAATFDGNSVHASIDIPLQTGKAITGTLSLPSGNAPAGGIEYRILARTLTAPQEELVVAYNQIDEGDTGGNFKITIPDDASENWVLGYRCWTGVSPACNDYLQFGYYKSGAANNTVEKVTDAEPLAGNANHSGKNISLLEGFTVSGTLSAPANVIEPGGMRVALIIRAVNVPSDTYRTYVVIPQGSDEVDYSVTVSPVDDNNIKWTVRYECQIFATPLECANYLTQGHYDNSGTVVDFNDVVTSSYLDSGQSYPDIDLTMLAGSSVKGSLMLSAGKAPAGGIDFWVRAHNTVGGVSQFATPVTIPEGASEAAYQINVDNNATHAYRVFFDCNENVTAICLELSDMRYYDANSGATVDIEGDAAALPGGSSYENIDMIVESPKLANEMCLPIKTGAGFAIVCL